MSKETNSKKLLSPKGVLFCFFASLESKEEIHVHCYCNKKSQNGKLYIKTSPHIPTKLPLTKVYA